MPTDTRKKIELPGRVSISKQSGGDAGTTVHIQVVDQTSGSIVFDLDFTMENFCTALFGQGYTPAQLVVYQHGNLGKTLETRSQPVLVPEIPWRDRSVEQHEQPEVAAALAPYEVDGWQGNRRDAVNGHRRLQWQGGLLYSSGKPISQDVYARPDEDRRESWMMVGFHRFV